MATRIREKAEKRKKEKDQRPFAKVRYIRLSPSKVGLVLDNIRGKNVETAAVILANMPNASAEVSLKLLNSAIANAENNKGLNRADLIVDEVFVTPGPTLKRMNVRARGRADRIQKKTCHITIILGEAK